MRYYSDNASEAVASQFWDELSEALDQIRSDSISHHYDPSGLRRLNMKKFPYHILFEELEDRLRVQVVRHNSRNPGFGMRRKRDRS